MRKAFILLFVLAMLPICSVMNAGVYNPQNIPLSTDGTSYVCNPDSLLSDAAVARIDSILLRLEDAMEVKTLVMVVDEIEGNDLYTFSMEVGNKYGIGTKEANRGLIITVAAKQQSWRILTGEGLEALFTDAQSSNVGRNVLMPYLKEQKTDSALVATVESIARTIGGNDMIPGEEDPVSSDGAGWIFTVIMIICGLIVLVILYFICRILFRSVRYALNLAKGKEKITAGSIFKGIFSALFMAIGAKFMGNDEDKHGSFGGGSFGGGGAGA